MSAVYIQKIFKGHSERNYLISILEQKYEKDMQDLSLKLQSIYRQVKEEK